MSKVSVIIPTYNGADTLRELLALLKVQTLQPDELLIVDSSSSDASVEVARGYGAEVEVIPKDAFDHGGTRTAMAQRATGDILVFFTQDALPATRDALAQLVAAIKPADGLVAAYGRQLPNKDATPAAARLRHFNYPPVSETREYADRKAMGIKTIFISNSFAAYHKAALAAVGYFKNGLIFGEDTCTVGRLLQEGKKVAYVAEAAVYHSHNYTLVQELKRSFDIGVLHAKERWLLDTYGAAEGRGREYVLTEMRSLWHNREMRSLLDFLVRAVMKILGYKLGRNYTCVPNRFVPCLSMHRSWWNGELEHGV